MQRSLNLDKLVSLLRGIDHPHASWLESTLRNGAPMYHLGPRERRDFGGDVPHSRLLPPAFVLSYIDNFLADEVAQQRVLGPFASTDDVPFPYYLISPLYGIPKDDPPKLLPGRIRLIHHLSYPDGDFAASLNSHVPRGLLPVLLDNLSHTMHMAATIQRLHPGATLHAATDDIKWAFRNVYVAEADVPLLGFRHRGQIYFDLVLPFGARASMGVFCTLSAALRDLARARLRDALLAAGLPPSAAVILIYVDDAIYIGISAAAVRIARRCYLDVLAECGLNIHPSKHSGISSIVTFLGATLNFLDFSVSLPNKKLRRLLQLCHTSLSDARPRVSLLDSVVGKLGFFASLLPIVKFFNRAIRLDVNRNRGRQRLRLSRDARESLRWLCGFASAYNGSFRFGPGRLPDSKFHFATDASGLGWGAVCNNHYFSGRWPRHLLIQHGGRYTINDLELVTVVAALIEFAHLYPHCRILLLCDNMSAVHWLNRAKTPAPLQSRLCNIAHLTLIQLGGLLTLEYINTKDNTQPDLLSRSPHTQLPGKTRVTPRLSPSRLLEICKLHAPNYERFAALYLHTA